MAGLAADQDSPHRAGIADALARRAALDLGRRRIGEIGQVALAGVDDQHAGGARGVQHVGAGRDRARQLRDIVAQRLAEAAGLEEIALHVDDDKRGGDQSSSIGAGSAASRLVDAAVAMADCAPGSGRSSRIEASGVPLCTLAP